jgi:hypothetical protein
VGVAPVKRGVIFAASNRVEGDLGATEQHWPSAVVPPGAILVIANGIAGGVGLRAAGEDMQDPARVWQWNLVPHSYTLTGPCGASHTWFTVMLPFWICVHHSPPAVAWNETHCSHIWFTVIFPFWICVYPSPPVVAWNEMHCLSFSPASSAPGSLPDA